MQAAAIHQPPPPKASAEIRGLARKLVSIARSYVQIGWCQGPLACTADKAPCFVNNPRCEAWSLVGALQRAELDLSATLRIGTAWDAYTLVCDTLQRRIAPELRRNLLAWNNQPGRCQAEVIRFLDIAEKAI